MTLDELGSKLKGLDETRRLAEVELTGLQAREKRAAELERDRDALLRSWVSAVPEALEELTGQERNKIYRMLRLEVTPTTEGLAVTGALGGFTLRDRHHRCGSYARCTTCRIQYIEGEPDRMTKAELEVLKKRDLLGQARLSCQDLCDHDIKLRVLLTVTSTGLDGPGPKPERYVTPEPEWVDKPA